MFIDNEPLEADKIISVFSGVVATAFTQPPCPFSKPLKVRESAIV